MSNRSSPTVRRSALAALLVLALGAGACSAPEDASESYHVDLEVGSTLVYRGEGTYARATLLHIVGADTTVVPNAVFTWFPNGPVEIRSYPDGTANIDGIARGTAYVYVYAAAYGPDDADQKAIRVADQVELDTVTPDTVAWGGRLTLHGVRVGNPNDVSVKLNGITLLPDTLSLIGDVDQVETMSYFVPHGATSGILQLTGFGLIATDSTPITILAHERFEPNDSTPTVLGLDTLQPYPQVDDPFTPGHPEIRLFEPQLSYEAPAGADSITTDWFHFVAPTQTAQPWTFVYTSPAIPRRGAFGVPPALQGGVPVFGAGAYGFDFDAHRLLSRCRGADLDFPVSGNVDSLTLSLQAMPLSGVDFVEYSSNAGTYGLTAVTGYRQPAGTDIVPDKFEDNDFCEQADANFLLDSLKIDLSDTAFGGVLSIDTPHEVDWYRFHVGTDTVVEVGTKPVSGYPDAQLDLYLFQQSDLAPVDSVVASGGADRQLSHALAAGKDYYLVVVNTDGTPTRYGLCIAYAGACVPPTAPAPRPRRARPR